MLHAHTPSEIDVARRRVVRIGKLSDNIIGLGRFGIGLDGMLAWIPGFGEAYSVTAGGLLFLLGLRVRAPASVLARILLIIGLRSAAGAPAAVLLGPLYPISGAVVDLFRGHKWSADMLAKSIDNTLYVEGPKRDLALDPALASTVAQARADRRRVVFLG